MVHNYPENYIVLKWFTTQYREPKFKLIWTIFKYSTDGDKLNTGCKLL